MTEDRGLLSDPLSDLLSTVPMDFGDNFPAAPGAPVVWGQKPQTKMPHQKHGEKGSWEISCFLFKLHKLAAFGLRANLTALSIYRTYESMGRRERTALT